jgi:predicted dehydrogenase
VNRRNFVKTSSAVAGSYMFSPFAIGKPGAPANSKLNVAFIGLGWQGGVNLKGMAGLVNVVGFCDVNSAVFKRLPKSMDSIPRFKDCRVMLDKLDKDIDAVVVSTPDHAHFWPAYMAMERGKHIFLEKPIAHTIWEARKLKETAHKFNVISASGNFGRASEGIRRLKEWVDAGVLGEVREAHGVIQAPLSSEYIRKGWALGAEANPPANLDWDLWLGSNPETPYRPCYGAMGKKWRRWWEYGNGITGDWGPHVLDGANYALDIGAPVAVESKVAEDFSDGHRIPNWTHTTLHYAARGKKPAMKVHWHTGGKLPKDKQLTLPSNGNGLLLVGDKHTLQADMRSGAKRIITMNDAEWLDFKKNMPEKTIPRVKGGHYKEWVDAIKGDGPLPGTNFDETGPLTEALMLIALSERRGQGKRIEWDAEKLRVTNNDKLNEYVNPPARKGFDMGRS